MNLQKPLLKLGAWKYSLSVGILAWALTCTNVLRSTWSGDDWPNSQAPYVILWRYGKITFRTVYLEAMYWNNQWMIGEGRFYPFTWLETRFAFSYLRSLWQYKLLESFMLFLSGALLILIIYVLSSSRRIAIFSLFALPVFVQFRNDFDPHLAFGFMVESLLIKIEIACLFAYFAGKSAKQVKSIMLSVLAGLFIFIGCCTYEYAFLLFPAVIIMYWSGITRSEIQIEWKQVVKQRIAGFSIIAAAWMGYAIFVFGFLRTKAVAINGAYVLSVSWKSVYIFVSQLLAPLPLTNFSGSDFPGRLLGFRLEAIFGALLMIIFYTYFIRVYRNISAKEFAPIDSRMKEEQKFSRLNLYLFGSSFVIAPSFMLAIQPLWWNKASIVHSYLGILISEFGYVILFATLFDRYLSNQERARKVHLQKKVVR